MPLAAALAADLITPSHARGLSDEEATDSKKLLLRSCRRGARQLSETLQLRPAARGGDEGGRIGPGFSSAARPPACRRSRTAVGAAPPH